MAKIYFKQVLQHHQGLNCHKAASIAIRPIKHSVLQEPQSALLDFNLDHYFNSFWIIVCRWEGQIQIFFVAEFAWYIPYVTYEMYFIKWFQWTRSKSDSMLLLQYSELFIFKGTCEYIWAQWFDSMYLTIGVFYQKRSVCHLTTLLIFSFYQIALAPSAKSFLQRKRSSAFKRSSTSL